MAGEAEEFVSEAKAGEAGSEARVEAEAGTVEVASVEAGVRPAAPSAEKWTKRGAAERREHITQTAAKLLLEGGSERLTHRRVAAAAGVPLGSTTQYFNSIGDLRRAGLKCVAESLDREIEEMSQRIEGTDGDIDALAKEYCDCLCDPKSVSEEIALYRGALNDPEVRNMFQEFEWQFIDRISAFGSSEVARLVSALWDGIAISTYLTGQPFSREVVTCALKALASIDGLPDGNGAGQDAEHGSSWRKAEGAAPGVNKSAALQKEEGENDEGR